MEAVIAQCRAQPQEGSYTCYLFDKGLDKILKKVGEECTEVVIASLSQSKEELVGEIGDLMYHLIVLMANKIRKESFDFPFYMLQCKQ